MNICFSATRLMKVSEVRRVCEVMRNNPFHIMVFEYRLKQKLRELQKRPAPQR
ncbi:hypothetical protein LR68_01255 [Anoxybacillus sp. BCO1]|nr:hypothetical protein LR68_01255 [Anoxybacillus sp. BCO1]